MKFIYLFLIAVGSLSFAQQEATMNSDILIALKSVPNSPSIHKRFSFEYCEGGFCETFGNPEGYDALAFENMFDACEWRRKIDPILANVLKALSIGLATVVTSGGYVAISTTVVATAGANDIINHFFNSGEFESTAVSNRISKALLQKELIGKKQRLSLSRKNFNALYDGIEICTNYYDRSPFLWLKDCDRDLSCKLKLVKDLYFSKTQIEQLSAYDLFSIREEILKKGPFN